jgi:starvation-inducible DNA-binding protein
MARNNKVKSVAGGGIGLPEKSRRVMSDELNRLLADTVVLYMKTRNFHWNVTGANFSELHHFFEDQYEALDENMDEIAERIRALDHIPAGALADYLKLTRLAEASGHLPAQAMLTTLLADHEQMARQLREAIEVADDLDDTGTEDFLTGLMEGFEKSAWMLRAYTRQ